MESLGDVLEEFAEESGLRQRMDVLRLKERWEDVVGPHLARKLSVSGYRNGQLWLRARDPSWSHQASMMRREIREKINREFGYELVNTLRIQN